MFHQLESSSRSSGSCLSLPKCFSPFLVNIPSIFPNFLLGLSLPLPLLSPSLSQFWEPRVWCPISTMHRVVLRRTILESQRACQDSSRVQSLERGFYSFALCSSCLRFSEITKQLLRGLSLPLLIFYIYKNNCHLGICKVSCKSILSYYVLWRFYKIFWP